ncbi:pyridoxal-phosphate dependent enzyme [Streptomyces bathyalis]|uniref:Pyridoxal-phosphate dependent enzyme n=1 Tax=Streptomyces bathyalis TaxID=2710756 RepID=A0A7T1TCV5_9ACTN|nr:pyridoxal-phosphate dependent enzyme [Streptomyces bathyalis]QPP10565.1 pyridoxal-phosphate dependent enzyme [Streptomyces bathyalis]
MLAALDPPPLLPSPLQEIHDERFAGRGIRLLLKRDDLIHPRVPGNKWRKLVPNLRAAVEGGHTALLTFGGAYSNHLRATAAAGRMLGLATVGVVRGDELARRPLNPSLARCAADGMALRFVSRSDYRRRRDPDFAERVLGGSAATRTAREAFRIPEGGSNSLAVHGCTALGEELRGRTDVAAVACGTGGTLAGLAAGLGPGQRALGVPVLRGGFLAGDIRELQRRTFGGPRGTWRLDERFHFGGYARSDPQLEEFARDFERRHSLPPLERIYVAKLLFALTTLADEGAFAPGSTVTAVVTGPR